MSLLRALVVDGDSSIRFTVRALLEHAGVEVDEASNGVEGLGRLDERAYGLLVTGLSMPRMSGSEMIERMAQGPAPRPKVVVVAPPEADLRPLELLGVFGYFRIPFVVDEMMIVVRRVVESA